jgi:hypothetical protein
MVVVHEDMHLGQSESVEGPLRSGSMSAADRSDHEGENWEADRLASWLDIAISSSQQIVRWMQGYDFPFSADDEPYLRLLAYLPKGTGRHTAECTLATRVAQALRERPDRKRAAQVKRPDQLLYNLLMLSAGLACQEQLWPALCELYCACDIDGSWRGIEVRAALREALIANQLDDTLGDVWLRMVAGTTDFLPGTDFDGMRGILAVPSKTEGLGSPDTGLLRRGLGLLVDRMRDSREGPICLRDVLDQVQAVYPRRRDAWARRFIKWAHRGRWPAWAIDALESMGLVTSTLKGVSWIASLETEVTGTRILRLRVPSRQFSSRLAATSGRLDELWLSKEQGVNTRENIRQLRASLAVRPNAPEKG